MLHLCIVEARVLELVCGGGAIQRRANPRGRGGIKIHGGQIHSFPAIPIIIELDGTARSSH